MSDHLPECGAEDRLSDPCICPWLRACEQRVRLHAQLDREADWREGRAAGLDAAREAVAAAPVAIREPGVFLLNRGVALAAIDALRKGAQ